MFRAAESVRSSRVLRVFISVFILVASMQVATLRAPAPAHASGVVLFPPGGMMFPSPSTVGTPTAEDQSDIAVGNDPRFLEICDSFGLYGKVDSTTTMGDFAAAISCTQTETAGLLGMVMSSGIADEIPKDDRYMSRVMGAAIALKSFALAENGWSEMQEVFASAYVDESMPASGTAMALPGESVAYAAGSQGMAFFNLSKLWKWLGWTDLFHRHQWEDKDIAGIRYESGFAVGGTPARQKYEETAGTTNWFRNVICFDKGSPIKAANPTFAKSTSTGEQWFSETPDTAVEFRCVACGWQGPISKVNATYGRWNLSTGKAIFDASLSALSGAIAHYNTGCGQYSELSYKLRMKMRQGWPGWFSIAGQFLRNPLATIAAFIDGWGIPGWLPPGAVSSAVDTGKGAFDAWTAKLQELADALKGMGESVGGGVGGILEGLSGIVEFFANIWERLRAWVISMTMPADGWYGAALAEKREQWLSYLREESIAKVFFFISDTVARFGSDGSVSTDYLRVSLKMGSRTLAYDASPDVQRFSKFRPLLVAVMQFGFFLMLFKWLRPKVSV